MCDRTLVVDIEAAVVEMPTASVDNTRYFAVVMETAVVASMPMVAAIAHTAALARTALAVVALALVPSLVETGV